MNDTLEAWLAEDLGKGDFTSESVIPNAYCQALINGGPGNLSGIDLVNNLLSKMNVIFSTNFKDGDKISDNELIYELRGNSHDIMKIERLSLNILSHFSGIATLTAKLVKLAKKINPNVVILATRKTIPGIREFSKKAVVHGGGMTHRLRLDDAILIKDNHLKLSSSIVEAVRKSKESHPNLTIEVEVDTIAQALEVTKSKADRVMLDNFSPKEVSEAVSKIRQISDIEIEVSGGINSTNIASYAPYADFISMSSLTMSAPPVDFSLHVI